MKINSAVPHNKFTAQHRSTRDGISATVLDPLLSILSDIRQLEDLVVSTLQHFGWTGSEDPSVQHHSSDKEVEEVEEAGALSEGGDVNVEGYIRSLLQWVDSVSPGPECARRDQCELLAKVLHHSDTGSHPVSSLLVECTDEPPPLKKVRSEGKEWITSLTPGEWNAMKPKWEHYEKCLSSCTKETVSLLNSICTDRLSESFSSHAKWIEVDREDYTKTVVAPSVATLRTNYDEITHFHDALAACGVGVHTAYKSLLHHIELYLEECEVVLKEEGVFWRNVGQVERECNLLKELQWRMVKVRQRLEEAISSPSS